MLADLDRRYTGNDYSSNQNTSIVTADMVRPLSSKSFPLCMRSMQVNVKQYSESFSRNIFFI